MCSLLKKHPLSIRDSLQPWLTAWELADPRGLDDWIDDMRWRSAAAQKHLARAGETTSTVFLLTSGLVRLYYVTADGRERNKAFYGSGDITGPVSAIISSQPASFSIQALESCELIEADLNRLLLMAPDDPAISRFVIKLLAEAFMRNEQREALLLTCNAEQRYLWLLEHQAELIGRIPQYHIAAYLGIDAVSLSRLKRNLDHGD